MKEPKIDNLKVNADETKAIKAGMQKGSSIKITINIDADTLKKIRSISDETGVPYQRLMNRILRDSLDGNEDTENRLDKLEKELSELKEKLAA